MNNHLATRIKQWEQSLVKSAAHCDISSSSVRIIKVPLPVALQRELDALAGVLKYDAGCLAGELLAAALQDTLAQLPGALAQQLETDKAEQARRHAEAEAEALRFDPGRT